MRFTTVLAAPAIVAAAAVLPLTVAPLALASATAQPPACTDLSTSSTQCQTPGNVQLTATPPDVPYQQQFPYFGGIGGIVVLDHHGQGGGHR
jgi:hypothetical protein